MKKHARYLFVIASGIFIVATTFIKLYNKEYGNLSNIIFLLGFSILVGFLSSNYGYKQDKKKSYLGVFLSGSIVATSILIAGYLNSAIPIYFAFLYIGFGLLFYGYFVISSYKKQIAESK